MTLQIRGFTFFTTLLLASLISLTSSQSAQADIQINRAPVTDNMMQLLLSKGVYLHDGHYWYDSHTGLWGYDGGPVQGQIWPGLPIQAKLPTDASRGQTGVYINNRELQLSELHALSTYIQLSKPGRYWLRANGKGGMEGQPASFDLSLRLPENAPSWHLAQAD
ncbi:MAG: hypothetical protein MI864_16725 [Pseudomonadales bacterium]|uniref:Uncharacterized protein n=1 Tax=Oleiphilus messinensis TaxID=141451 RepID=A0A1Y0I4Q2_9GAMM|nr:hypothetical protein [Oleiphilus messinensis]ARU54515.1 hypothetical protein OLMES_0411 [Oleiphilus messinensis]MCG8612168.1 hypothetical protein [Pseudomonadales bacterium]